MLRITIALTVTLFAVFMLSWRSSGNGVTPETLGFAEDECFIVGSTSRMALGACLQEEPFRYGVTWADQLQEARYRVSGRINYWYESCDESPALPPAEIEFAETLPADSTVFLFPPPPASGFYWIKEYNFRVEALDSSSDVIENDSFGLIAEPAGGRCRSARVLRVET